MRRVSLYFCFYFICFVYYNYVRKYQGKVKMKVSLKNKNDSTWFVVALEEEFASDKYNVLYS